MSFNLKIQHWHVGTLVTHEHKFKTLEQAHEFIASFPKVAKIKIYDENKELVHEVVPVLFDELMYA